MLQEITMKESKQDETCIGEKCNHIVTIRGTRQGSYTVEKCDKPATHKVGEELSETTFLPGMPNLPMRHNLTAYVCCDCFTSIFGMLGHQDDD